MSKYDYHLECFVHGAWVRFLMTRPLAYCQGFLDARKNHAPRLAYRIVRSDGRVMEEVPAKDEVSIGQIAGWPTAEQYEAAAKRALEMARVIREQNSKRNNP